MHFVTTIEISNHLVGKICQYGPGHININLWFISNLDKCWLSSALSTSNSILISRILPVYIFTAGFTVLEGSLLECPNDF